MKVKELIVIKFFFIFLISSCQKTRQDVDACNELKQKKDSLLEVNKNLKSNVFFKFGEI